MRSSGTFQILALNGSASASSSNEKLIDQIIQLLPPEFSVTVFDRLQTLPHFDPKRTEQETPPEVIELRERIAQADGVLFSTPEYIFSIPSALKNAFEWCVSTTVFSEKPTGILTASASGEKGHAELQLIMKTLMATFTTDTTLLIQGIKGKINIKGEITDEETKLRLRRFTESFVTLCKGA